MFTFIDLFAGIGGFRIAIESLGGECIASSEIAKGAIEVYRKNWPEDDNLGSITNIEALPPADLIVGGVPCQSWSIAGKNLGITDPRGALWNDVIRLTNESQPKAFMFENVKGLSEPRHKESLEYIIESFENYNVNWRVLNSYDFGVPQNRERIFIVGIRKDLDSLEFHWPLPLTTHEPLHYFFRGIEKVKKDPVESSLFNKRNKLVKEGERNPFFSFTDLRGGPTAIHSWDLYPTTDFEKEICITIKNNRRKKKYGPKDGNPLSLESIQELLPGVTKEHLENLVSLKILKHVEDKYEFVNTKSSSGIDGVYRVYLPSSTFFSTITATGGKDMVALVDVDGKDDKEYKENFLRKVALSKKYRELTGDELRVLQGFPEDYKIHEKEKRNVKLFGNSVSVPVIRKVGESIVNLGIFS